jgi:hypothetical protein
MGVGVHTASVRLLEGLFNRTKYLGS